LTEAIDEIAANPPSSEMQEVVKELEDDKEKLKKENKDLKNQIKKFKRASSGKGAIEVKC
jgi:cell division protein FtsB